MSDAPERPTDPPLRRALGAVAALARDAAELALTEHGLDALLARAIEAVRDATGAPCVAVFEGDAEGALTARAALGWPPSILGVRFVNVGDRLQAGHTISVGATVISDDLDLETRFEPSPLRALMHVRSSASVPIRVGGGVRYGAIIAHALEPRAFDADRVAALEAVAAVLGAIIARARDSEHLREREESLRLATEASALGTWEWSPGSDAITWSERTYEIYGMDPGSRVDYARYAACLPDDARRELEPALRAAMDPAGPRRFRVEHRIRRERDGVERWAVGHGRVLFDAEGRPARVLGTVVDVTEQALARRATEDARAALAEAMRAKDEFLAMLGHELRNPLAPIVTALRIMQLRGAEDSRERAVIERQVRHLTRLVDDLLDVSRIAAGRVSLAPEVLEVGDVVARAVELASPLIDERRHRLEVSLPGGDLRVLGDATRLAQVVSNLLTNAAKYTPPGGSIAVTATPDGEHVELRVRDNGSGITPELLPRVFDLFAQGRQSLDRSRGGLGLGLAIVRSLVSLHGGTVAARSEGEGRGSEFVVRLPAHRSPEAPAEPPAPEAPRVLLVVGDDGLTAPLVTAFRAAGWAVATAADGPTALAAVQSFAPGVAVVDLALPVMDGHELARALRARCPVLRLVALEGHGPRPGGEDPFEGFAARVPRPVDRDALVARLRPLALPDGAASG